MAIEIVDFPMKNGGFVQFAMLNYQRVNLGFTGSQTWQAGQSPIHDSTGWWFGVTWLLFSFFSPIVGMMIQSDFPIFQGGRYTTNQPIHFYDFHIQDGPFGRGFPANDVWFSKGSHWNGNEKLTNIEISLSNVRNCQILIDVWCVLC